jgi:hypothetical protein
MSSPAQQAQQISSTGARDANGDSLSSLPSRALGSSSGFGSSSSSSFSSSTPLEKRDSRSLKRGSGGFSKISGSLEAFEGMVRK